MTTRRLPVPPAISQLLSAAAADEGPGGMAMLLPSDDGDAVLLSLDSHQWSCVLNVLRAVHSAQRAREAAEHSHRAAVVTEGDKTKP